jgi:fatty acid desaturase/predicted pyridoxine 5'-phosphate oxidase superfamily flavin-nucleotide-binding protein
VNGRYSDAPAELRVRTPVTRHDEATFLTRIGIALVIPVAGGYLALESSFSVAVVGVVLIALTIVHWVELAHQCLHHSAFRSARLHRPVGVVVSLPFLVSYSHYRIRHLQHHKWLGTPADTEFFGFDTSQRMTWRSFVRNLFDYGRILSVLRAVGRSAVGSWAYPDGQISRRTRRHIMTEYCLVGGFLVLLATVAALGHGGMVLRLWLLPFLIATPLHFLVELPEHIGCDTTSTSVLHNTRSITGSPFSRWFTNSNNLHVEHHLAMTVPLQILHRRHASTRTHARHVVHSYPSFYRNFLRSLRYGPNRVDRQTGQADRQTDPSGRQTADDAFYHSGSIGLQRELGTERLADHIATRYVATTLSDADVALVEAADCFYLATADGCGRPECSYKGGIPGFVRVPDRTTLRFPSYDGNGMFRSLGNIRVNPAVGLLFIDYGRPVKLRINGEAVVHTDAARTGEFTGADAVVEVRVLNVFENCPRYLHDRVTGEHSVYCPRENHRPVDPDWKKKPEYDGIVRRFEDPPTVSADS